MNNLFALLAHPYPRYGLAVALVQDNRRPQSVIEESTLRELLVRSLESGLEHFRMMTHDDPASSEDLRYYAIAYSDLQRKPTWIQSAGLAAQGIYLYPTVITSDGSAKGTYENAVELIKLLTQNKPLLSRYNFSRSFAPTTAKINQNGRPSLTEPPGTLFESACSAIATLTPHKPAAWVDQRNTAIFPDLALDDIHDDLFRFVDMFIDMCVVETGNRMHYKLPRKVTADTTPKPPSKGGRSKGKPTTKSEYRRPAMHSGNYPYAPRDAEAFGTAGLLGAIGRWAHQYDQIERADAVLALLQDCPLYIVNYDGVTQAQFEHHVVGLAQKNRLYDIVRALTYDTKLYAELESDRPQWNSPARKLFALFASRFLQSFSLPAFRDFLSVRAEYSPLLNPLFEEYFMSQLEKQFITPELVSAARALGQWINLAAYRAAKAEVEQDKVAPDQAPRKIQQHKAKILVALDSMAMGARTAAALTSSILRETGMLANAASASDRPMFSDAPQEAIPFLDATVAGIIDLEQARQLLMTYMRVRSSGNRPAASNAITATTTIAALPINEDDEDFAPLVADDGE